MILLNKHHSYFFSIGLPMLILSAIIGLNYQSQILTALSSSQWLCAIMCIVLPCMARKQPIHQSKPRYHWLRTTTTIALFQSALWLHLLGIYRLTLLTMPVDLPHLTQQNMPGVATLFGPAWLLFPWSLYAVLGISIAMFCYQPNKQGFLSDAIAPLLKNKKDDAISLFINYSSRSYVLGFIVLSCVFCLNLVYVLAQLTHTKLIFAYSTPALLLSSGLMLPIALQKPRTIIAHLFQQRAPAAFTLCAFLILLAGYTLLLCALFPYIQHAATRPPMHLEPLWLPGTWQQRWHLFMILYAICWAPLAAGLIAHLAQGYSPRQVLCMALLCPMAWMLYLHSPTTHPWTHWMTAQWPMGMDFLLSCLSLLTMLMFFYRKKSLTAMIRAQTYLHTDKMRSAHVLTRSILMSSSIFLSMYAISGIQLLSFMVWMLVFYNVYYTLFACVAYAWTPRINRGA